MSAAVRRQLPNILTMLRVVLAAAFFACLNAYRYPDTHVDWANIAIGLFIAAAITDALDGYLARKWHVESIFGRLMDPFCDKVLIIGAFMYITGPDSPSSARSMASRSSTWPPPFTPGWS